MNRDDIIRMAREAALANEGGSVEFNNLDGLEHFANLVAAREREMCARVCDEYEKINPASTVLSRCAAAIRARGE